MAEKLFAYLPIILDAMKAAADLIARTDYGR